MDMEDNDDTNYDLLANKKTEYEEEKKHPTLGRPALNLKDIALSFNQKRKVEEVIQAIIKCMKQKELELKDMLEFTQSQKEIPVEDFWNRVKSNCKGLPTEWTEEGSEIREDVSIYLLKKKIFPDSEDDSEEDSLNVRMSYDRIHQVFKQNGYSYSMNSSSDFE